MNHTGVRSTGSRRAARTRSGSTAVRLAAVSKGPLAVRWGAPPRAALQAGTTRVVHGRAGERRLAAPGATRSSSPTHWLDDRDNPIVWDGTAQPGAARSRPARAPRSRLACARRSRPAATGSRSTWSPSCARGSRSSAARCSPTTSRSARATASRTRRCRASVEPRAGLGGARARRARRGLRRRRRRDRVARRRCCTGRPRELAPYAPGPGRVPGFSSPLLCPSVLPGIELEPLGDGRPACRRSPRRRTSRGSTTGGSCCARNRARASSL